MRHLATALAILVCDFPGVFAASCVSDTCLNRVNCGDGCVADCVRHVASTITPLAVTVTTSVVFDPQATVSATSGSAVNAPPSCDDVGGFPYWAAVCNSRERFRSACSCIGASTTTFIASTPTSTTTVTIVPTSGSSATSSSAAPTNTDAIIPTGPTTGISSAAGASPSASISRSGSATVQTTAFTTTNAVPVILTVIPGIPPPQQTGNQKRGLRKEGKRKDTVGGFVDVSGTVDVCSDGTSFNITTQGQLTSDGRIISTRSGEPFIQLAPSDGVIGISTVFVVFNKILHWQNAAFAGGEAGFCQVVGSGKVYATFTARESWPPGCESISIMVYKARQCRNGVIDFRVFVLINGHKSEKHCDEYAQHTGGIFIHRAFLCVYQLDIVIGLCSNLLGACHYREHCSIIEHLQCF
ncbi:hypothetical protein PGQ11_012229 [Apiospora arundinis]|uniref:DUF7908 domain-containing protein n=1 Tax=Apiospora arundinis TaxID=335852 RepID=A0ABR2I2B5_9PEZI